MRFFFGEAIARKEAADASDGGDADESGEDDEKTTTVRAPGLVHRNRSHQITGMSPGFPLRPNRVAGEA
jgi:hypothetical protein